ncbi:MAG: hypothetical protein JEZ14_08970 [Marinilabiliaceae bacterium]|nr:hypothetical protein [Marinilabiliaceae bacterium]
MGTNLPNGIINQINKLISDYSKGKYAFVSNNTDDFIRKILNAAISKTLNVAVKEDFLIYKNDNRALLYFELRILVQLRTASFRLSEFNVFVENISKSYKSSSDYHKVDMLLLEVLPIFKKYIKDPGKIDQLIQMHQYVSGLWKNGSKFLHFYTLHNEEHSIELIKYCTKITARIDYLKLKSNDYFILFLACYLHDISMVIHPNIEHFTADNAETDLIYSKWKKDIYKLLELDLEGTTPKNKLVTSIECVSKSSIKQLMLNYFTEVDQYFSNNIRENHANQSATYIKEQRDLRFIESTYLHFVAGTSEAHYFEAKDVYKRKSEAKSSLFSEKYLMIILRLADLLDMSRDRVSTNFMDQNIKHMPGISQYHWISHLSINSNHIESQYTDLKKNFRVNGDEKVIKEEITIVINLNTKLLTQIKNGKCKYCNGDLSVDNKSIEIEINKHTEDNVPCSKCNFTCKWFVKKQGYLISELYELQRYLNRAESNIFQTVFKIQLKFDDSNQLKQEYLDIVQEHLN